MTVAIWCLIEEKCSDSARERETRKNSAFRKRYTGVPPAPRAMRGGGRIRLLGLNYPIWTPEHMHSVGILYTNLDESTLNLSKFLKFRDILSSGTLLAFCLIVGSMEARTMPNLCQTLAWTVLLALSLAGLPAQGAVITFDEFPADDANGPMPAGRYASLGVTFATTDDGSTWGGIDNGDPGNWDINGTNGPIFSGYNGSSYDAAMLFGSQISGFSLDVSRSNGSSAGNTFTLEGYQSSVLVETTTIDLLAINTWSTVSLLNDVDEVRWFGTGTGFHPFGVDNIRWNEQVPEPITLGLLGLGIAGMGFARKRRLH